jgi:hypothetical protein
MLFEFLLAMPSKRRITVTLDEDTYQFFAHWAKEDDRTVPYLLAKIAASHVKQHQTTNGNSKLKEETPLPSTGKRAKD